MQERTCPSCGIAQMQLAGGPWIHVNNNSADCDVELLNPSAFPVHPPRISGTNITRDVNSK